MTCSSFRTNGGPGCSSLEGLLQENGVSPFSGILRHISLRSLKPFSWSLGQAKPTVNEYSWTNLSSVLWVEQPVGTGFSQGVPNAQNEEDVAAQLAGFLQQFLEVFAELKGKQLYLTGESVSSYGRLSRQHTHRNQYAGTYVPCQSVVIFLRAYLKDH